MDTKEDAHLASYLAYLPSTLPFLHKTSTIPHNKTVALNSGHVARDKSGTHIPWFQYILYAHILILYIIMFSMYNELKRTRETMLEFHTNMINISIKGMEVEKNCLSEISNFRNMLNHADDMSRYKRDVLLLDEDAGSDLGDEDSLIAPEDIPHSRIPRKVQNHKKGNPNTKISARKRGRKRHHRRQARGFPRATHFIGALPEPIIRDGGLLSSWVVDKDAIRDFSLNTKVPERGREAVQVIESGLYFIYAQVYYLSPSDSSKSQSSFYVMVERGGGAGVGGGVGGGSGEAMVAQCATLGDGALGGEASCFTATARTLNAGDVVFIRQRERHRHIIMKPGQTFLGLVLLNKRATEKTSQKEELPVKSTLP